MTKIEKKYTDKDLWDAHDEAVREHYIILHYLLNKNSHPQPDGVDFAKLFDELQDYEEYLREML